jgi:hypothetical protein
MSPFLRLPAEIRNHIYDYIFSNNCIEICQWTKCTARNPHRDVALVPGAHTHYPPELLHLLEVCKQIYAETKLLAFSVGGITGKHLLIENFLDRDLLTTEQKNAIEKVNYTIWHVSLVYDIGLVGEEAPKPKHRFKRCLQNLRKLEGLKEIVITSVLMQLDVLWPDQGRIQEQALKVLRDEGLNVEVSFDVETLQPIMVAAS